MIFKPKASGISGVEQVLRNIDFFNRQIGKAVEVGLKKAGLILQAQSQGMVPVDTGNLKASAFTRARGKEFQTNVFVGYTAAYAIFVHENIEMKGLGRPRQAPSQGNYWDPQPQAQAKFLEAPMRRFQPTLNKTVALEVRKVVPA